MSGNVDISIVTMGFILWLAMLLVNCAARELSINLAPIADSQHTDNDTTILNVANDAPVANAVFPVAAQLRSGECFPNIAGIFQWGDTLFQEPKQPPLDLAIQTFQVFHGLRIELDLKGQAHAPLLPEESPGDST